MIPYTQLSTFGYAQPQTDTPSWLRIDNFVDFVLTSRSNSLLSRLAAFFRR